MSANILDQKQALESFFDSLMHDVEAYSENEQSQDVSSSQVVNENISTQSGSDHITNLQAIDESEPTPIPTQAPAPVLTPADEQFQVEEIQRETRPVQVKEATNTIFETLPPAAPPEIVVKVEEITKVQVEEVVETTAALEEQKEITTPTGGKPDWAENEFQAMLFKVAGLTLAVPLVELHGIVEWNNEKITLMPGHSDFYIGLMTHLGKKIPVVDTARLVLPPDKLKLLAGKDPYERINRVVLINDSQYGLACDDVDEVITLKPDEVRWRSERTQRSWLAGTVVEHMCALLDARAFAELLSSRAPVDEFRE